MGAEGVLVFDLGTQSLRASVIGPEGQRWYSTSFAVTTRRSGLVCEQDASEWRHQIRTVLTQVAAMAVALRAVVASGTLGGAVCLSSSGHPLRPVLMYGDRRPAASASQIEQTDAFEQVRRLTGWRSYAGDLLPQALYIARQETEIFAATEYVLDSTGYLNWLLTGRATLDEYSLLTCYSLPGTQSLNSGLFSELRLDGGKFGSPVRLGQVIGELRGPATQGLPLARCPVIAATYDSMTAYIGSGRCEAGEAFDISGTVTSFGVVHHESVIDRQRRIYSVPLPGTAMWLVRGSTAMASGCLDWCRAMLGCKGYAELDALASQSKPGASGVIFLPFLAGERAPVWKPEAKGAFYGLTTDATSADLARAVYEGLSFALRHIQVTIAEHGVGIAEVSTAGGLSRNALLLQIRASVTGKRLSRLRDFEVTTAGAAAIAAHSLGWHPTLRSGFDQLNPLQEVIEPRPDEEEVYRMQFELYRDLVGSISHLFDRGRSLPNALSSAT